MFDRRSTARPHRAGVARACGVARRFAKSGASELAAPRDRIVLCQQPLRATGTQAPTAMERGRGDRPLHLGQGLAVVAVEPAPFRERRQWTVRIQRLARDSPHRRARLGVTTGSAQGLRQDDGAARGAARVVPVANRIARRGQPSGGEHAGEAARAAAMHTENNDGE